MTNKTIKRFFTLIVLASLFSSCEKEEVEKEYRWKKHENFVYTETAVLNSFATNDYLYMIGRSFYSLTDESNNSAVGGNVINYSLDGAFNVNYKMAINDLFYVNASNDYIAIVPTKNPTFARTDLRIPMNEKNFNYFELPYYSSSNAICINSNNQVAIPYRSYSGNNYINYYLVDVKVTHNSEDIIDTIKTRTINFPNEYVVMHNFSYKDYFIATLSDNTYKIYSNGTSRKISDNRFDKIFQKGDTLFGVNTRAELFISSDDGENWQKKFDLPSEFQILNYYLIDNQIIATHCAQLFHITINNQIMAIKEIDNDGLINNFITSVAKFKNKIYVTTLSGVYYRQAKDFFTYKEKR